MTQLFLDDLYIGQKFVSESYALSEEKIIQYAQEFDPQIFHLDPVAAEDTFFKGLAASGWHTAAITMRLLVNSLNLHHGIIGAGGDLVWPQPTRSTDILSVESEIIEIKPSKSKPNQALVTFKCETKNQHAEAVQILHPKLIAFKKLSI